MTCSSIKERLIHGPSNYHIWTQRMHVDPNWKTTNSLECSRKPTFLTLIIWSSLSPAWQVMESPNRKDLSSEVTQSRIIVSFNVTFLPTYEKCWNEKCWNGRSQGIADSARRGAILPVKKPDVYVNERKSAWSIKRMWESDDSGFRSDGVAFHFFGQTSRRLPRGEVGIVYWLCHTWSVSQ